MRADTVEEPAVVTDDDGTAGEGFETFLQGAQRVDVDVVGRLVEEQHVALLLQGDGQMQTVALTAGEHAALLLLVGSAEVEARQIGPDIDIAASHADGLIALAHHLIDTLVGQDILVLLVDIAESDRLANVELPGIGLFQAHDESEERRLTRSVRTNNAHNAVGRQHKVEVAEEHLLAKSLCHMLRFNHLVAQTRSVGNEYFELLLLLFLLFVEHRLVAVQTGLSLGVARLRSHAHPFQFAFERLAAL